MQRFFVQRKSALSLLIALATSEKNELAAQEKQRCLRTLLDVRARRVDEFFTTGWEDAPRHLIIITPS